MLKSVPEDILAIFDGLVQVAQLQPLRLSFGPQLLEHSLPLLSSHKPRTVMQIDHELFTIPSSNIHELLNINVTSALVAISHWCRPLQLLLLFSIGAAPRFLYNMLDLTVLLEYCIYTGLRQTMLRRQPPWGNRNFMPGTMITNTLIY